MILYKLPQEINVRCKEMMTQKDLNEWLKQAQITLDENKRIQKEHEEEMRKFYEMGQRFSEDMANLTTREIEAFIAELKRPLIVTKPAR